MKFFSQATILAALFVVARAAPILAEKKRMGPDVGGAGDKMFDPRNSGATDTRQPPIVASGREEPGESCGGESMHHQYPCEVDVDSPEMGSPTDPPVSSLGTSSPTDAPSVIDAVTTPVPTAVSIDPGTPSSTFAPTASSSGSPLVPCISTDGTFGVVSETPETDVTVSYMYEMETAEGISKDTIDNVILPQLEKAIVDSVLEEVFQGGCIGTEVGKRRLRFQRRQLAVTGITMNPSDLINEEFVCDSSTITDASNGCNVIDGQLTLYTSDGEARGAAETIESIIRENMNNGAYASANPDIERLVYLDTTPSRPDSNTGDNTGSVNDETSDRGGVSNELRVGLFVGLIGGAIVIAGVLYRAGRNGHSDDETELQTAQLGSVMQPPQASQSFNDAGAISYEDSVPSYDESGMVMADTGMDSASSDGLGIAA